MLRTTDRKCSLVHGCGVSPERMHSSLVPWSQNSWTWARPRDRNFSTMDCSLAVLAFSSSRISLLTYAQTTSDEEFLAHFICSPLGELGPPGSTDTPFSLQAVPKVRLEITVICSVYAQGLSYLTQMLEWVTQVEEDVLGCCGRHLQTWGWQMLMLLC